MPRRRAGHCEKGHRCIVTGLFIYCETCDWIDDSCLEDLLSEDGGFVPVEDSP